MDRGTLARFASHEGDRGHASDRTGRVTGSQRICRAGRTRWTAGLSIDGMAHLEPQAEIPADARRLAVL